MLSSSTSSRASSRPCWRRSAAAASSSTTGSPGCRSRSATSAGPTRRPAGAVRARAGPGGRRAAAEPPARNGDEAGARLIALNMALSGTPREETGATWPSTRPRGRRKRCSTTCTSGPAGERPAASPSSTARRWPRSPTSARSSAAVLGPEDDDAARRGRRPEARRRHARPASCTRARPTPRSGGCSTRSSRGPPRRIRTPRRPADPLGRGATSRRPCACPPTSPPSSRRPRALGQQAWVEARAADDFAVSARAGAPFELRHRYVACFDRRRAPVRRAARRLRARPHHGRAAAAVRPAT